MAERRRPTRGTGSGNGDELVPEAVAISEPAPEHRGGERRTAIISGVTFTNRSVVYSAVDGMALIEGDIALGTVEQVEAATQAARETASSDPGAVAFSVGITGSRFRWPNCQLPYQIDPNLPDQQRVTDAISHWEANTPLRFPLRTSANQHQHPNYLHFTDAGGCWSMVGMQGGEQTVSLGPGCTTGNTIHEIGHAVGLWHEQSREDRDLFVTVHWENIQDGQSHNFNQHITDGDDLGGYDYGSIMHYPRTAFSRTGSETITPTDPAAQVGQRTGLSAGDIAGVRTIYPNCGVAKPPLDPRPRLDPKIPTDPRPFKKLLDDEPVIKPILDVNPGLGNVRALRPFTVATGHHASFDAGAATSVAAALQQQLLDVEAAIAAAKATAAQANAEAVHLQQVSDSIAAAYEQAVGELGGR